MVVIQEIVAALWQHDFAALANPGRGRCISGHVHDIVSGKRSATRFILPGDSLLLLAGALIAKGVADFIADSCHPLPPLPALAAG